MKPIRRWFALSDTEEMVYLFRSKRVRDMYLNKGKTDAVPTRADVCKQMIELGYGAILINRFFREEEPVKGVDY